MGSTEPGPPGLYACAVVGRRESRLSSSSALARRRKRCIRIRNRSQAISYCSAPRRGAVENMDNFLLAAIAEAKHSSLCFAIVSRAIGTNEFPVNLVFRAR